MLEIRNVNLPKISSRGNLSLYVLPFLPLLSYCNKTQLYGFETTILIVTTPPRLCQEFTVTTIR